MKKQFIIILGLIALLAIGFLLAKPYLNSQEKEDTASVQIDTANIEFVEFKVEGMTCDGCANSIEKAVGEKEGVVSAKASFEEGNAKVEFDGTLINTDLIESIIQEAGYTVIGIQN